MDQKQPFSKGRRLRIFAGPNGSGKTTIYNKIQDNFDTGIYVNPDLIQNDLVEKGKIKLHDFSITGVTTKDFQNFISDHSLKKKAIKEGFDIELEINEDQIISPKVPSAYTSSLIADFIRYQLIDTGKKLAFETVMSHPSKLEILDHANKKGYKCYLYFICTNSPLINIDRVNLRVELGGHNVEEERIKKRYFKTLNQLKAAVKKTYRTFIFDTSEKELRYILEVFEGEKVTFHHNTVPDWVDKYLLS